MNAAVPEHLETGKPADAGDLILERRHRLVREFLPSPGSHLVDFGCGNGAQTEWFSRDFRITGLDVSEDQIREFVVRMEGTNRTDGMDARGIAYDGHVVPLESESADCAISFEVLEHVEDEAQSLGELFRILRPGGVLAISVPNRWWVFETHGASLPLLPWNRVPFFSWLPKGIHDRWARARIYRRREIQGLLERQGFEIEHSAYVTAPMDVVKSVWLRDGLRATVFRGDTTRVPVFSTAVLMIARKPGGSGGALEPAS